jgi:hypothetical protein
MQSSSLAGQPAHLAGYGQFLADAWGKEAATLKMCGPYPRTAISHPSDQYSKGIYEWVMEPAGRYFHVLPRLSGEV